MKNYKIVVEYNGKNYSGWQIQEGKVTIQGELERAVFEVTGETTQVVGSGRTDAGVSAKAQVANFLINKEMNLNKFALALNAHLPDDIAVRQVEFVDEDFSARFSSKKKTYNYYFYVSNIRHPLYDNYALQVKKSDVENMKKACKYLIGEHDYSSFVARNSGKTNFVRTIYEASIEHVEEDLYCFSVTGSGFLYNMVRIIMGTLIMIGEGKKTPEDMQKIINAKNRTIAGKTVGSVGLVLKDVKY